MDAWKVIWDWTPDQARDGCLECPTFYLLADCQLCKLSHRASFALSSVGHEISRQHASLVDMYDLSISIHWMEEWTENVGFRHPPKRRARYVTTTQTFTATLLHAKIHELMSVWSEY